MSETTESIADKLSGRVAQVLNERELVINIGSNSGVKAGMKFAVMAEQTLEVRDPVTNEILDRMDREKVRVEVSEIRPRISICRTYRKIGGSNIFDAMAFIGRQPEIETLRSTKESNPRPLSPEESYVKINDRVVQLG